MRSSAIAVALAGLLAPAVVSAQIGTGTGEGRAADASWGITDESMALVSAWDFIGLGDAWITTDLGSGFRYVWSGTIPAVAMAPLQIPSGVLLESIEIQGCDTDPTQMFADIRELQLGGPVPVENGIGAVAFTGGSFAGGCGFFSADLSPAAHITNNAGSTYRVRVTFLATGDSLKLAAVRVRYRRVIAPPPPAPTFGDVPAGHLFYPFIEALAASGITAGCNATDFCPDDPITRGQMAVFLAKALGLQWPN